MSVLRYQYWPDKNKFLRLSMAIGRVMRKEVEERAEVSVPLHRLNNYNCIYFPESSNLQAYDPGNKCCVGDVVLLKKLPEIRKYIETHAVEDIVFKVGNIVDPITGLRVEKDKYLTDSVLSEEEINSLTEEMSKREFVPKYSFEIDNDIYHWESRNLKQSKKKK